MSTLTSSLCRPAHPALAIAILLLTLFFQVTLTEPLYAEEAFPGGRDVTDQTTADETDEFFEDEFSLMDDETESTPPLTISDPLYRLNLVIFHFNDKLYYWVLKPGSKGYNKIFPKPVRKGIENFFSNLDFPLRFINCTLQGKFKSSGTELARFCINSTIGLLGFLNAAKHYFGLTEKDEDLGQTFAKYGIKGGIYIVLPFMGPSTLRDSIGDLGDGYMSPTKYINPFELAVGVWAYEKFNFVSLNIGGYESLKEASIDPYNGFKSFYLQHRQNQIEE